MYELDVCKVQPSRTTKPANSLDELEYYQAEREAFGLAVMNFDTETQAICDSFILAFDRLLNCSKQPHVSDINVGNIPNNGLDELERWVKEQYQGDQEKGSDAIIVGNNIIRIVEAKIKELKTITT